MTYEARKEAIDNIQKELERTVSERARVADEFAQTFSGENRDTARAITYGALSVASSVDGLCSAIGVATLTLASVIEHAADTISRATQEKR